MIHTLRQNLDLLIRILTQQQSKREDYGAKYPLIPTMIPTMIPMSKCTLSLAKTPIEMVHGVYDARKSRERDRTTPPLKIRTHPLV